MEAFYTPKRSSFLHRLHFASFQPVFIIIALKVTTPLARYVATIIGDPRHVAVTYPR